MHTRIENLSVLKFKNYVKTGNHSKNEQKCTLQTTPYLFTLKLLFYNSSHLSRLNLSRSYIYFG